MTAMRIVNTSSTGPTFYIIEREPVFVNPFITLMSQNRLKFCACESSTQRSLKLFYLPIHHFPSQNRRLHPIVPHLLLWHTQNIFA
jgi:hypothetical protein